MIIATFNRPEELEGSIRSVLRQTLKPDELIVVDDGNLPGLPLEKECRDAGIQTAFYKKDEPGLTASRNLGISVSAGEIILFIDDDVVLDPGYVEAILRIFSKDKENEIGGVGGVETNNPPRLPLTQRLRHLLSVIFLNSGFTEGRVLPSGFCVDFGSTGIPLKRPKEVEFLPGVSSSYRREVFEKNLFSTKYKGYGLGEDKDLSYRVAQDWKLISSPDVRLHHLESPKMRYDKARMGQESVIAKYRFFKEVVRKQPGQWFFFWYAMTGYFLTRIIIMLFSFNPIEYSRVRNMFAALGDIVKGKAH